MANPVVSVNNQSGEERMANREKRKSQNIPLRYTTHQLTKTAAKLSTTPHQKGRKNAPQLSRVNNSQNVFF